MNNNEEIIVNVSFIVVFFLLGFCFRGICCNNNNEGVYLDRVIELQGELDELERQTNEVHQDQRRQINDQQAELREFRYTSTLVVAVPTARKFLHIRHRRWSGDIQRDCGGNPREHGEAKEAASRHRGGLG